MKRVNHPQNEPFYRLYLLLYTITTNLHNLAPMMDNFTKELLTLFLYPCPDSPFQLYASFTTEQLELTLQHVPDLPMQ